MDKGAGTIIVSVVVVFLLLVKLGLYLGIGASKEPSTRRSFGLAWLVVIVPILIFAWVAFSTAMQGSKTEDIVLNTIFGFICLGIVIFFINMDIQVLRSQKRKDIIEPGHNRNEPRDGE